MILEAWTCTSHAHLHSNEDEARLCDVSVLTMLWVQRPAHVPEWIGIVPVYDAIICAREGLAWGDYVSVLVKSVEEA